MNQTSKMGYVFFGVISIIAILSVLVWAQSDVPYGIRDISYIQSSVSNVSRYPPANITAEAGNVTELILTAISRTKAWQGYYGNVTGQITLEDANGFVFYNWSAAEPKGKIYASTNDTVSWINIICFDWEGQAITRRTEELRYGIGNDSADGIDETYTQVGLDRNFFVGSRNITQVTGDAGFNCHSTNTFQYDLNGVADNFENTLLTDGANGGALVFTTIIENNDFDNVTDIFGFDNQLHDFQLLVAEDGHDGQEDTTTTYYFWAEIE